MFPFNHDLIRVRLSVDSLVVIRKPLTIGAVIAVARIAIAGCSGPTASQTSEAGSETGPVQHTASPKTTPESSPTSTPALSEELAIEHCASRLTANVFDIPAAELGAPYSDSFGDHYSTSDARANIVDGEWYIEFPPTHEDIATLTCQTDGENIIAMTRAEFEEAMNGRTYDGCVEVTK